MITGIGLLKAASPAAVKAGTLLFQKLSRLRKINDAMDGVVDDDLAKAAVVDFEIVKGSWKGEFDTAVDKFLRAFEASGLSQAMFHDALLQSRSPALKRTFIDLFTSEVSQPSSNGELLYRQVTASFEVSARCYTKDAVMARVIAASHQELMSTISMVEASLDTIRHGILNKPDSAVIADIIPRILRSVAGDTKFLRVETSQGRRDVDISKIYISPRLGVRNADSVLPIVRNMAEHLIDKASNEDLFSATVKSSQLELERSIVDVNITEIESLHRTVVLGNPGGGKSTLLQSVCHSLASKSLRAIADGESPSNVVVPIRIVLRDYEHARSVQPQLNLIDYIARDLLNAAYADEKVLIACIQNLLSTGQAYLAFDGLDEILKTANRRQFVDIVNRFVRQYPLCQVLITSREVGYDNAPLATGEYEELILRDFADEDVAQYAERFIKHVGKKKVADARRAAERFVRQTTTNAADLRRNPLMLGLMMWIFNIRDDVPSNRPEIYQECARLMFERWGGERGIIVELPQTFDRLQVFSYLASRIFDDDDRAAGVSGKWIETEVREHLSEVLESVPQARAAAASLVQFITDRAWVMSEKGEGVFAFTHQTFLEYFFAKFNDDQFDTVKELFLFLLPRIKVDEWDVVCRLSLQIKTHRNRRRQDEAIDLLVETMEDPFLGEDERRAVAGFSIRCLEFLMGSEAPTRVLIERTLDTLKACYVRGHTDAVEMTLPMFEGARERRAFIIEAVETWLCHQFANGLDEDRDFVLACIDGFAGKFGPLGNELTDCRAMPAHLSKRFRGKIMPLVAAETTSNPKSAKTLFEWTGTVPKSAVAKFGVGFIHYARPMASLVTDGLSALVLAASGRYSDFFRGSQFSKAKAEASLITLGEYWRKVGVEGLMPLPSVGGLNNPPVGIWMQLMRSLKADVTLRLAAATACYIELNNFGLRARDRGEAVGGYSEADRIEVKGELIRQARLAARLGAQDIRQILETLATQIDVLAPSSRMGVRFHASAGQHAE